ncbi:MAG: phosphoribosylformylglycinamidine cyclo-ligase [archaeon]|nr:MAG: phosphoribosylformylglycinamidine cyclo-ligase [archaeon]
MNHSDGAGSKPVQNYLNWKETGDINAFRGIAQDTLAMNIGDSFCVGVPVSGSFVDYVAINPFNVPKGEVLRILSEDWSELFDTLKRYKIEIKFAGGETADLPDQMRTLDVSGAIHTRYRLDSVITGEEIIPKDKIIGLASGGQASYEKKPAGAIMCNGITVGRHKLMKREFGKKYPEILNPGNEYTGPFSPTDEVEGIEGTIGEEITRPTRIFAPVFKGVVEQFGKDIHGIVLNTGGGHTKCRRMGKGICYVKDNLPEEPQIFKLIQNYGDVPWREMYEDFNMGIGAELYVKSSVNSDVLNFVVKKFNIEAPIIGKCMKTSGPNKVKLKTSHGDFNF